MNDFLEWYSADDADQHFMNMFYQLSNLEELPDRQTLTDYKSAIDQVLININDPDHVLNINECEQQIRSLHDHLFDLGMLPHDYIREKLFMINLLFRSLRKDQADC